MHIERNPTFELVGLGLCGGDVATASQVVSVQHIGKRRVEIHAMNNHNQTATAKKKTHMYR